MKIDFTTRIAAITLAILFVSNDVLSAALLLHNGIPNTPIYTRVLSETNTNSDTGTIENQTDINPNSAPEVDILDLDVADALDFQVLDESQLMGYKVGAHQVAPLPTSVVNVTRRSHAYKLQGESDSAYHIAMGVDAGRLGRLDDLKNVQIFFYDRMESAWKRTHTLKVDEVTLRIEAMVPGGTDYFAGLLQSPEMPEASAYVPTNISDIEPANPATGMNIMQPPSVNRQGSANISYPLDIPQGRQGMTPPVSLSYSSEGGSSWMGEGWNISVSSISVDTKWGVPDYMTSVESDPYVLDGAELYMNGGYRPNRPNPDQQSGSVAFASRVSGQVRFYRKVENGYSEIIRHGSSPSTYFWVVTDASGNKQFYGTTDGTNLSTAHVLRKTSGEIAQWKLARVEDKWGNFMEYDYDYNNVYYAGMKVGGQSLTLSEIRYTGHGSTQGKYAIRFVTDQDARMDGRVMMNYGFKVVDDQLLEKVEVYYGTSSQPIKEFRFEYVNSATTQFKSLLTEVSTYINGQEFYSHQMDYYDGLLKFDATPSVVLSPERTQTYLSDAPWYVQPMTGVLYSDRDASPLGNSITNGYGWTFGGGIGTGNMTENGVVILGFGFEWDKASSITLSGGNSRNETEQVREFRDVNGDGLSDFIFTRYGVVYYQPVLRDHQGNFSVGQPRRMHKINSINSSSSSTVNFRLETSTPYNVSNVGASYSTTTSMVHNQLIDYNSDGFVDYITHTSQGDRVYFGVLDELTGEYTFEGTSLNTPNPVYQTEAVSFPTAVTASKKFETVRVWEAFDDGEVSITGPIEVMNTAGKIKFSIQRNANFLVNPTVHDGASGTVQINQTTSVNRGDKLIFRVDPEVDGQEDLVSWDPQIKYSGATYVDGHGNNWGEVNAGESFVLSDVSVATIPADKKFRMQFDYGNTEKFSDDVQLRVRLRIKNQSSNSDIEYVDWIPAQSLGNPIQLFDPSTGATPIPFLTAPGVFYDATNMGLSSSDTIYLQFEVGSTSNNNWRATDITALIEFENECPDAMHDIRLIPDVQSYDKAYWISPSTKTLGELSGESNYHIQPDLSGISSTEIKNVFTGINDPYHELVYMTVKSDGKLLQKIGIRFDFHPSTLGSNQLSFREIEMKTIGEQHQGQDFEKLGSAGDLSEYEFNAGSKISFGGEDPVEGAPVLVDFHAKGIYAEELLALIESNIGSFLLFSNESPEATEWNTGASYYVSTENDIQQHFLNWGMFAWSPDPNGNPFIDPSKLISPVHSIDAADINETDIQSDPTANDPNDFEFWSLNPISEHREAGLWDMQSSLTKKDRYSLFGTHVAIFKTDGAQSPGFPTEIEQKTGLIPDVAPAADPSYEIYGMLSRSNSKSLSVNTGTRLIGGSLSISDPAFLFSRSMNMMSDFDGDGYPDVVYDSRTTPFPTLSGAPQDLRIAKSDPLGGLMAPQTMNTETRINKGTSFGVTASWTGAYTNENRKAFMLGGFIGANGTFSRQRESFFDINGDGLADAYHDPVLSSVAEFRLNEGGTFEAGAVQFSHSFQNKSQSLGSPLAMHPLFYAYNIPFSLPVRGLSFGLNVNENMSQSEEVFMDLNGDGLTDHISLGNGGPDVIYLNTGTSFEPYSFSGTEFSEVGLNESGSTGFSAQVGYTAAPVVALVKLVVSGSYSDNYSQSRVKSRFEDINGDGAPDAVIAENGKLEVYYGQWGKANMLSTVTNPLGGSFTIDYKVVGNKRGYYEPVIKTHLTEETNERILWDMPTSKWVMSSLTVDDKHNVVVGGEDIDGPELTTQRFAYDGGIKIRRDRNFAGFTRVATYTPDYYGKRNDECASREDADIDKNGRDISEYYNHRPYETPISSVATLDEATIKQYNYAVLDYVKPESLDFQDMKAYSYQADIALHNYMLHAHSWRDYVHVTLSYPGVSYDPEETRIDSFKLAHVDLISDQGVDYELRIVDQATGKVKEDNAEIDDWLTFDESVSPNDVSENLVVFQATTDKRNINYPKVEDRAHLTTQKFHLKYDAYKNVIWYEDYGTMLSAQTNTYIVDTIVTGHYDTIRQAQPCDHIFVSTIASNLGNGDSLILDGIHYLCWIQSLTPGYENDTLYGTFGYDAGCMTVDPTGPYAICADESSDGIVYSTHVQWVEEESYVYKVVDNSTYDFRIIAQMFYRDPVNSQGRTNMLKRHEIYTQDPQGQMNLERYTVVTDWWQTNMAPATIRNQLDASYNQATDPETELEYDIYGNVDQIIGAKDHQNYFNKRTFTYDSDLHQLVTEVVNHRGSATEKYSFMYNTEFQYVEQTVDINGHPTRYFVDEFNRMVEVWAPKEVYAPANGPTIEFAYYPKGINPSGSTYQKVPVAFTYHNTSNTTPSTTFRNAGNLHTYRTQKALNSYTASTTPAMASSVRTATLTDKLGAVVQIQTDSDQDANGDGINTSTLRISGLATKDDFGSIVQQRNDFISSTATMGVFVANDNEIIASTAYDLLGRPFEQSSIWSDAGATPSFVTTSYEYQWRNGLANHSGDFFTTRVLVDGSNSQTQFVDARGRTIGQTNDAESILTEFVYDELGQLQKVVDPKGLETEYTYDNFGRVTSEDHPDRGVTNTTYDRASNVLTTSWEGTLTSFSYEYSRLTSKVISDANSSLLYDVHYVYGASDGSDGVNAVGRMREILQGANTNSPFLKDVFEYDELGQTHRVARTMAVPNQGTQVYNTYSQYDSFGRVLRLKYPDNELVDYHYTDNGSLLSITSTMPSSATLDVISNITYDGYDNISYIQYGNGTETEYEYHTHTRALLSTDTYAKKNSTSSQGLMNARDFTYNNKGLITDVDFYVNTGLVSQSGNGWSSFHHDYDQANRLDYSKLQYDGSKVYDVQMTYNSSGAILGKDSEVQLAPYNIVENLSLTYNLEYTYSSTHRLVDVKDLTSGETTLFTYNDQGSISAREYKDASGTLDPSKKETFVWNTDQQLVAVKNANTIQHYVYDYTGTRIMKTDLTSSGVTVNDNVTSNTSVIDPYKVYVNEYYVESSDDDFVQTTKHYYMGMQRVLSDLSLQELQQMEGQENGEPQEGLGKNSSSNQGTSSDPVMDDFNNRMKELGLVDGTDYNSSTLFDYNSLETLYPEFVDDFNSTHKTGYSDPTNECCFFNDRYWYHPDYLGSVAMVTNDEGVVHQFFLTNAWGEELHTYDNPSTSSFNSEYRFNGKELDEETGLAYYGARYYDNQLSMWLSVDRLAAKYPHSSPYAFSQNNPIAFVDPNGDSTLFILLGEDGSEMARYSTHDGNENAVTVLEGDAAQSFMSNYSVARKGGLSDKEVVNLRSGGISYAIDEWKSATLGNSMSDETSIRGVEGYHPEYKAFGYLDNGMVRPGSDVIRGDSHSTNGSASFEGSVNKGHAHPDADRSIPGQYPYSFAHRPSRIDQVSEYSENNYHDLVVTPEYIYFINSRQGGNFVIPQKNTFTSKVKGNPWGE